MKTHESQENESQEVFDFDAFLVSDSRLVTKFV